MRTIHIILLFIIITTVSCEKDFLEPKSDKKLVVPTTLKDIQALLNNTGIMNTSMSRMGEVSSDDYYVSEVNWNNIQGSVISEKNGYIWKDDLFKGEVNVRDWNDRYLQIFYANTVLEGLNKLQNETNSKLYNEIKGSALFFRAKSHFELSQLFCDPYVYGAENNGLGIPLILYADVNRKNTRSTINETYKNIIDDLAQSLVLLPAKSQHLTLPNKSAALAMLAKTYLSMQDYEKALSFSDQAIQESDAIVLDFNEISNATYPMQRYNSEVMHHSTILRGVILSNSMLLVDTSLYASYEDIDLRKNLWFGYVRENLTFKGSYDGSITMFGGITLAEMYLIKAECLARTGSNEEALATLNFLLVRRYNKKAFAPVSLLSSADILNRILLERRKELIFRGIRWSDLRRLNLDTITAITLQRRLSGNIYELKPNSFKYTLPLPDDAILLGGYEQNPRE